MNVFGFGILAIAVDDDCRLIDIGICSEEHGAKPLLARGGPLVKSKPSKVRSGYIKERARGYARVKRAKRKAERLLQAENERFVKEAEFRAALKASPLKQVLKRKFK